MKLIGHIIEYLIFTILLIPLILGIYLIANKPIEMLFISILIIINSLISASYISTIFIQWYKSNLK